MQFAVLVKVVPAVESLQFDPDRRSVIREGAPLFLNPFDQRALRVALELRRPGERATVLSLGPPSARAALREAKAVGADRVILLTDPAFAGSDTLATARLLTAALRRLAPDVVVGGAWTTDSETGQVGPEVAAMLGRPVLSSARSLLRRDGDSEFEAKVDTADGWATYRLRVPFVVTVGEKIGKPLKADPSRLAEVPLESVELWGREAIDVPVSHVGTAGSPTTVESVEEVAPRREPFVETEGSLEGRVDRVLERLAARWRAPPVGAAPFGAPPTNLPAEREILVVVTGPEGQLDRAMLGPIAEARRSVSDGWPSAVWVGSPPSEAATYDLERAGALGGHLLPVPGRSVDSGSAAGALAVLLTSRPHAAALVLPSDPFGREVAGQLAARRGLGLVGDVTGFRLGPDRRFRWEKPSFGGRTVATITCRTTPELASVRPGVFAVPDGAAPAGGFGWTTHPVPWRPALLERLSSGVEVDRSTGPDGREVVVAVGMGVGGPDGISALRPLVERWGAGLAATRRVVDAGWVPPQLQVGLTGRSSAPRLVVLLGVSGSVNHLIGWRRAGTILAVNRDAAAPVFRESDLGVVGSIDEVLPRLEAPVARLLGR